MNHITSALLFMAAHEDQGIYPMSTTDGGVTTQRTPWQEGWNAAHMTLMKQWATLCKWCRELPPDQCEALEALLSEDAISIAVNGDEPPQPWLIMNDTFGYACADGTNVAPVEFADVLRVWRTHGHDGLRAWAAKKKGCDVIPPLRTPQFLAAKAALA